MDDMTKLRHEMAERLQEDQKVKREAQERGAAAPTQGPYEQLQQEYPGETIFALAVILKCPWAKCGAIYPVGIFVTKDMGQEFHVPCHSCKENFVTVRDAVRILGKNTYPVDAVQKAMREQEGNYKSWMNMLHAAYQKLQEAGEEVWKQSQHREHVIHEGGGSKRPVTLRMSSQTADEALQEMKPTTLSSRKFDPMQEMDSGGIAEFFADPDVAGKFGG